MLPDRVRRARLPRPAPAGRSTSATGTVVRHPAARRASRTATACPSRSTRPAFKAPMGEHDENISFERTVELVGADRAEQLRDLSLEIYERASRDRRGARPHPRRHEVRVRRRPRRPGDLTLADEVLTSDSSRYWDAAPGRRADARAAWRASTSRSCATGSPRTGTRTATPPELPDEIVEQTAEPRTASCSSA